MTRRYAFSLIEMLVVISIIALLIAIIQPALHKAKYNARVTICMTSIRSQEQAQKQLADDNVGKFWRHYDYSADYVRSGGASGSLWDAIKKGRYLADYAVTICPIIKHYPGPNITYGNTYRTYVDESWTGSDYAGFSTNMPQILTTYLWFGAFEAGNGTGPAGSPTNFLTINGRPEPQWPGTIAQASSDKAFITHRISGGPGGYASHDLGHGGIGLGILPTELLLKTTDQPVGFADGHVILRTPGDIKQRTVIFSGGIGYYYY